MALQLKAGRPPPLMEMRVIGEDGREQPWDGRSFGKLQVRGPWVLRRYFKVPCPSPSPLLPSAAWIVPMVDRDFQNILIKNFEN